MRRTIALFLTLLLLWGLLAELNHSLTGFRVYIFGGALFVVYAALNLPMRSGLATSLLAGLVCDANTPVAFGTHFLLFAAAHVTVFHVRDRVPRDDNLAAIFVVLLTNLALFLMLSFAQIHRSPAPAAVWPRLFADLLCSQIFLTLITPWFFALQGRTLKLVDSFATVYEHRAR